MTSSVPVSAIVVFICTSSLGRRGNPQESVQSMLSSSGRLNEVAHPATLATAIRKASPKHSCCAVRDIPREDKTADDMRFQISNIANGADGGTPPAMAQPTVFA